MSHARDGDGSAPLGAKVALFTVLGLVLLVALAWTGLRLQAGDRAPRSAKVEGVSIAGLGPAAAEQRLRERLAARVREPIEVSYGDGRRRVVRPSAAGLGIDYRASIAEAGGGGGWGLQRMWEVVSGGGDHRAELTVDEVRMQAVLDDLGEGVGRPPVEGSVAFRAGRAVAVPGRVGVVLSRSRAQALLERRFLHGGSQKLPTEVQAPEIDAAVVRRAAVRLGRRVMSGPVTLVLGGRHVVATPRLFGGALSTRPVSGDLELTADGDALLAVLAPVVKSLGAPPRDARVVMRGGRPAVLPSRTGVSVDPVDLGAGFARAALQSGAARRVVLRAQESQPSLSTAGATALRVRERVSTYSTSFPYSDYRNVNLPRAAARIDGTLLVPGATFSFNRVVGQRSKATGYREAYVEAGSGLRLDPGAGDDQVATTTYAAMLQAGLEDVAHTAPRVHVAGLPLGREVDVAWPSTDLRFDNDTPYGVLVTADVLRATPSRPGRVTVSMWSARRYAVSTRTSRPTGVTPARVRTERGPACRPRTGSPGMAVDVLRYLRDPASGTLLRTQKFHTDYAPGLTVRCAPPPRRGGRGR